MQFAPERVHVVAQSIVQCEIRLDTPTVLSEEAKIKAPAVGGKGPSLDKLAWSADEKINDVASRFAGHAVNSRAEEQVAIFGVEEILLQLIEVVLASEFQGVRAEDFAEVVEDLEAVLGEADRFAGHSNREAIEVRFGDAFHARSTNKNTGRPIFTRGKSELGELHLRSAKRLVKGRIQAEEPETEFIYCGGSKSLGIPKINNVSLPLRLNAKSWIRRIGGCPVRIDAVEFIPEKIYGEQSPSGVVVHPPAEFVVVQIYLARVR